MGLNDIDLAILNFHNGGKPLLGREWEQREDICKLKSENRYQTKYKANSSLNHRLFNREKRHSVASGFPLTTNQEFHNEELFNKAREMGDMNKSNYKRKTVYNAYANATFSSGMFHNNAFG